MENTFSHLDEKGTARMVDVSVKTPCLRTARAEGKICLQPETLKLLREKALPKGDVLTIARIAGIQAAKQTAQLIPLCHTLPLSNVRVDFTVTDQAVEIEAEARVIAVTGVEMEALTAVSVAALTIYDMCKAIDKSMRIEGIRLVEKTKQ